MRILEYYRLRSVTLGPFVLQMGHVSMATGHLVVAEVDSGTLQTTRV